MKTTSIGGRGAAPLLLLLAALAADPAPVAAQDVRERTECRCVDADGNVIESCTCLRTPALEGLARLPDAMGRMLALGPDRPRVGISLDPTQAPEDDARGARVQGLLEDGPADQAGLREGDLVVRFDGHDLLRSLEPELEEDFDLDRSIPVQRLLALARRLEPGEEVEVEYLRDGERRTTTLEARALDAWGARAWTLPELGDLGRRFQVRVPDGERFRFRTPDEHRLEIVGPEGGTARGLILDSDGPFDRCPPEGEAEDGARVWVFGDACPGGLRLVALNPELGEYFGVDGGVLVADVHPDSPLGLRPGDVIRRIGERDADSPDRVRRILRSYEPEEAIPFHIVRDGRTVDVQGRLAP